MFLFYKIYLAVERRVENYKVKMLKKKMKFCGSGVLLYPSCHIIVPEKMEIGDNSSIAPYTTIYATFGVSIGKNCLISSNCGISSYNHVPNSDNRRRDEKYDKNYSKSVLIGDNVWIGMNVCILPGITIGNNSIIGAGSVVTKPVPGDEIWVGNPARFFKKIEKNP